MASDSSEQRKATQTLSIAIPLYNEEECVQELVERIHLALEGFELPWELILVSDGSVDSTLSEMELMCDRYGNHVRSIELQRNFGQTAAMQAGIDAARGSIIATMDGDLQNDPKDIPRMVRRLIVENLDLVVGWRKNRQDNLWLRKIPSGIANRLIRAFTGVDVHDYGCSLKIYRASVIKNIRLFGEMHRFIPAWVAMHTSPHRIREEIVNHHARSHGKSKYGISRAFRVVLDLLAVHFFMKYSSRPGHFFGVIGLGMGTLGGLMLGYLLIIKLLGQDIGGRPLLLVGILFVIMAIQFITTGVLSEVVARTYYAADTSRSYIVRHEKPAQAEDEGWRSG